MARRRAKRIVVHLLAWPLGAVVVLATLLMLLMNARIVGKRDAPRSSDTPGERLAEAEAILQFESHTCGLLSLAAVYTAHGLSPEGKNLRFRLGVDRVAHPFDSTSTGTLHPDLLRVLVQDGFAYTLVDPSTPNAAEELGVVLDSGSSALLLIRRRENGALHWVVSDARRGGTLRVVDSLRESAYAEPAEEFLRSFVLSVIAVSPAPAGHQGEIARAHADGIAEMRRVYRRISLTNTSME